MSGAKPLAGMEFLWPVRVYYEDTDAAGLVYHSNYLKFMERARTEWLRAGGHSARSLASGPGIRFVVREMTMRFFSPARLDQLLEVRTRLARRGGASLVFEQSIHDDSATLLCAAEIGVACLDAMTHRPKRIPEFIRKELDDVH